MPKLSPEEKRGIFAKLEANTGYGFVCIGQKPKG